MFEQFNIPVKSLMDAEIRKGDLNASYDAIILPADSVTAMTGETGGELVAAAAVARARRRSWWWRWGSPSSCDASRVSQRLRRGRRKALQAFVQKGGTLVTFGQAGDLPIQRFNLPVRNVVGGLGPKEFWSPVRRCACRFDPRHPLAFGMPREGYALFLAGSQAYEITTTSPNVETFVTFADREILQSGWLLGEGVIARKAAAVSIAHGDGRVVLLGFRPQHRDQTVGTFKLVFNALFTAPPASSVSGLVRGRASGPAFAMQCARYGAASQRTADRGPGPADQRTSGPRTAIHRYIGTGRVRAAPHPRFPRPPLLPGNPMEAHHHAIDQSLNGRRHLVPGGHPSSGWAAWLETAR